MIHCTMAVSNEEVLAPGLAHVERVFGIPVTCDRWLVGKDEYASGDFQGWFPLINQVCQDAAGFPCISGTLVGS